ncbi:WXG100 family type VII secretion target [Nonomuraea sp. NPDC047897]|uniref:bifunctional WXG100 family type VII secretion target/C40 family peptidase n=1 Tax=Nonomuraea sp. NPDC047897 TaxID=3364346 RepID=UPI003713A236
MDVSKELAALPGGDELAGILKSVNGDPAAIRGVAKRWQGTAKSVGEHTGTLRRAVKTIDAAWEGGSADDFVSHMEDYHTAGDGLRDALNNSATALEAAATALETAESRVRTLCGNILAQANAFRLNNPRATQKQFEDAVAPLVRQAVSEAKLSLTSAKTEVGKARTTIRSQLDGRRKTFVALTPPQAGRDWQPTPVPNWSKTTLASTNGGGGRNGVAVAPSGSSGYSGYAGAGGPGGDGGAQAIPYVQGNGTGADIVSAARQHIGKPYIWGANGPSAFDCSGLVYYTLNQAGIKIGDTTAAGYQKSGQPVTDPQPGDIVFFGQPASHVGIYVGNGEMIHAPRPGADVTLARVSGQSPIMFRRFT